MAAAGPEPGPGPVSAENWQPKQTPWSSEPFPLFGLMDCLYDFVIFVKELSEKATPLRTSRHSLWAGVQTSKWGKHALYERSWPQISHHIHNIYYIFYIYSQAEPQTATQSLFIGAWHENHIRIYCLSPDDRPISLPGHLHSRPNTPHFCMCISFMAFVSEFLYLYL